MEMGYMIEGQLHHQQIVFSSLDFSGRLALIGKVINWIIYSLLLHFEIVIYRVLARAVNNKKKA